MSKSIRTYWIALYKNGANITHFNSFGVECISNEIKKMIGNKSMTANIFRMQAHDCTMCG